MLQSQDLRVGQVKEPYIRVNTRELNRRRDSIVEELSIHVYYTYLKSTWGYGFNSLVVLCVG